MIYWSRNGSEKTKRTQGSLMKTKTNRNSHISFKREDYYRRCVAKRILRILRYLGREKTKNFIENSIREIKA